MAAVETEVRLAGTHIAPVAFPRSAKETTMQAQEIIRTHPHVKGKVNDALVRCIDECYQCAQTCIACADACLGEKTVAKLLQCIRLNQDCAGVCEATGAVATRRTGSNQELIRSMLDACALACRVCGEECERHASEHEHCRICAESCRRCEEACHEAKRTLMT
jgi:hypothetical protein